jgi:hypothetical protein
MNVKEGDGRRDPGKTDLSLRSSCLLNVLEVERGLVFGRDAKDGMEGRSPERDGRLARRGSSKTKAQGCFRHEIGPRRL